MDKPSLSLRLWSQGPLRLLCFFMLAAYTLHIIDGVARKGWWHGVPKIYFHKEDEKMRRILSRVKTLHQRFFPTFWAHSKYAQLFILLIHRRFHSHEHGHRWLGRVSITLHSVLAHDGEILNVGEFTWGNHQNKSTATTTTATTTTTTTTTTASSSSSSLSFESLSSSSSTTTTMSSSSPSSSSSSSSSPSSPSSFSPSSTSSPSSSSSPPCSLCSSAYCSCLLQKLPPEAPLLLILHTITGRPWDEMELARYALRQGWRPMVLLRRGHHQEIPLLAGKFNVMGCTLDTAAMVKLCRDLYPSASFIGAIGISAGSGALVSYISRQHIYMQQHASRLCSDDNKEIEGKHVPHLEPIHEVQAAVSLCPAYDIEYAFGVFDQRSPWLARYLVKSLQNFFLHRNEDTLKHKKGYEMARSTQSMQEFLEHASHMAGYESFKEYLTHSNPMQIFRNNRVPCLLVNALDDPLCIEENIPLDIASRTNNYAMAITVAGSHVAFRDGLFGE
eukprot:g6532.t1